MTKETESVRDQLFYKYIDALNARDNSIDLIEEILKAMPSKDPNKNMKYMLSRGNVAYRAAIDIVNKQEMLNEAFNLLDEEEEKIEKLNNSLKNTQGTSPRLPKPIEEENS